MRKTANLLKGDAAAVSLEAELSQERSEQLEVGRE